MDLKQLENFVAVAENGNITQTANQLYISQPALSASISKLESELGFSLFDRVGKRIVLSPAGQRYYESIHEVLQSLQTAKIEAQILANKRGKHISLANTTFVTYSTVMLDFVRQYPDYTYRMQVIDETSVIQKLRSSEVDFCFTCATVNSPVCSCIKLLTQKLFVTVPKNHPLANRSYVTLHEVINEPFILPQESAFCRVVRRQFEKIGNDPNVVCEASGLSMIAALISGGMGISLLPACFREFTDVVSIPVSTPRCVHDIYLVWRNNIPLSPACEIFLQYCKEFFSSYPKTDEQV